MNDYPDDGRAQAETRRYEHCKQISMVNKILYCTEMDEMGQACSTYGEKRGAYRILVGIPEGRQPLERPRSRWKDNIKMCLQKMGWGMDWIELVRDRDRWRALVNAIMNLRAP
jgi:hypothetical protein